jgi:glycosyltransferase involved in cell wall biosynthesis
VDPGIKKLILITRNFPPSNIVGALRPFRLVKYATGEGWSPVVLTFCPDEVWALDSGLLKELSPDTEIHYVDRPEISPARLGTAIRGDKPTWAGGGEDRRKVERKGLDLIRKWTARSFGVDPDIFWASTIARTVIKKLDPADRNVLVTTSPPHSIHAAGLIVARARKIPWVVDFRDPWDQYPSTGRYEIRHPIPRLLERSILRTADSVISTTETNTRILRERHPSLSPGKFRTVTNTFDARMVEVPAHGDTDHFVISYTGIFYSDKDPYTFFRALRSWFDAMRPEAREKMERLLRVRLIGTPGGVTRSVVSGLGLDGVVRFVDRVPHPEAIRLTKQSDLVLVSIGLGHRTRPGWLPSKLFEYLGCGVPILAIGREGEMMETIRRTNSGYVITSEDHAAVHRILEEEIRRKFDGGAPVPERRFTFTGVEEYEEKNVFRRMTRILDGLVGEKSNASPD